MRLLLGINVFKCWVSADGVNWGRVYEPKRGVQGRYSHFGMFCVRGNSSRSIQVKAIEVRELDALNALAPGPLVKAAPGLGMFSNLGSWNRAVLECQPKEADPSQWRRAVALRTLSAGTSPALAMSLLTSLARERIAQPVSVEDRVRLLDETAMLLDSSDAKQSAEILQRYHELGEQLLREGRPDGGLIAARAAILAPIWNLGNLSVLMARSTRNELLPLTLNHKWEELAAQCREWNFWNRGLTTLPPERARVRQWVSWAESRLARNLPGLSGVDVTAWDPAWRHPFEVTLSKEGYNTLAEFEAALESKAFEDACLIISSATEQRDLGLLPDGRDPDLFVSLPGAVALAVRDYPELHEAMAHSFGPAGRVRLRVAMVQSAHAAVEASTIQFYGTQVAAEAHGWLGDRALARGDFMQSVGQYRRALRSASPGSKVGLKARSRLAGAMLGYDLEEPVSRSVELGETLLTAVEFENLVQEMRGRQSVKPSRGRGLVENAELREVSVPLPSGMELKKWAQVAGDVGRGTTNSLAPSLDWHARQIATVFTDKLMIVTNRFHAAAYDLASGQRKWVTGLGGDQGAVHGGSGAQQVPAYSMRPMSDGRRVYLRRLTNRGPELAALEIETGKLLWRTSTRFHVLSDPVFLHGQLSTVTMKPADGMLQLSVTSFDPETGETLAQRELLKIRDAWGSWIPARLTVAGDQLVATIGGCVLNCSFLGEIQWLRRQTWLPSALDPKRILKYHDPPLVHGRLVYVAQPSVHAVECVELETGRLRWRRVASDVQRILGVSAGQVVLLTDEGLRGFDARSGEPRWKRDGTNFLDARLCGDNRLLCARQEFLRDGASRPALQWIDPRNGRELGRAVLPVLEGKHPLFGPLVTRGKRLWAFHAELAAPQLREIAELIPQGDGLPGRDGLSLASAWRNTPDAA
ncbi:MAG: PQQ-binding-like beta-propeller repeat protein, partial [Planctomycetales bacterium]